MSSKKGKRQGLERRRRERQYKNRRAAKHIQELNEGSK